MTVTLGTHPRYLEELRIGGGYGSVPDGGADFDGAGNVAANGTLHVDGAATFGDDVTVGGDFSVTGVDTTWSVYLPANLGMPDPLLPCGPVGITNWRNYQVATASLAFDAASPEAAYFQFRVPPTYDGRPLTFTLEWAAESGTGGDVRWGVLPISIADGNTLDKTGITTYVNDTFLGGETLHVCEASAIPTHPNSDTLVTLRVIRLSNNGADTFDADALLLGVSVSFQ